MPSQIATTTAARLRRHGDKPKRRCGSAHGQRHQDAGADEQAEDHEALARIGNALVARRWTGERRGMLGSWLGGAVARESIFVTGRQQDDHAAMLSHRVIRVVRPHDIHREKTGKHEQKES